MKMGDKVIVYGYIDGCSYETTGQTNYIIALETGERVEIPLGGAINADEIVFKDNIKLKDVIKRIKGFDDGTKFKWTYDILKELGSDFYSKIFHEAYQQGKLEGAWVGNQLKDADKIRRELNKPVVPQFVADYIDISKFYVHTLHYALENSPEKVNLWLCENEINRQNTFARAWLDGYEVEKEKQYLVKLKNVPDLFGILNFGKHSKEWLFSDSNTNSHHRTAHTRKELEDANFGWVFDCEGIVIEEVE